MHYNTKPPTEVCEMFLRNVPVELRNQFKANCARRGLSMTKVVQVLMERYNKNKIKVSSNDIDRLTY